ncbi:hypothetical protein [[Mycobacterium] crassicus]|uniref:Uncharacterized protein n=1 Tax=[Mycobacterium] crassicus TaxID=2872309 RepID=A0ABU5XGQ2_9MYCO|nr:hypothetical protein [Mycolicibacter sp. MYC098]MEB3021294.1 hypothetical protein [Mycolicibacter sp. MYC098]
MNVRELITALQRFGPAVLDLPVVIENENIEYMPEHAELIHVEVSNEFCADPDEYAGDGGRAYDKPAQRYREADKNRPTSPVVLLTQQQPWRPTLDGEVVPPALPARQNGTDGTAG